MLERFKGYNVSSYKVFKHEHPVTECGDYNFYSTSYGFKLDGRGIAAIDLACAKVAQMTVFYGWTLSYAIDLRDMPYVNGKALDVGDLNVIVTPSGVCLEDKVPMSDILIDLGEESVLYIHHADLADHVFANGDCFGL